MQNAQGGGSVAITREAFDAIGGMDESFVGWGGEDNEFWERACLRRVWHWGELPLVHLWHPAQQGKYERGSQASRRYEALSAVPAKERVAALLRRRRHGEATC
jgi:predicted glycosyltransferase involved in capsule biosynthesis